MFVAGIRRSLQRNGDPQRRSQKFQVGSNLGPSAAKLGPKPCTMTQNKARRANKIDSLQLPWAQEVSSSNLDAPTTNYLFLHSLLPYLTDSLLTEGFGCANENREKYGKAQKSPSE